MASEYRIFSPVAIFSSLFDIVVKKVDMTKRGTKCRTEETLIVYIQLPHALAF